MLNINLENINFNKCKYINEKLLNIKNVKIKASSFITIKIFKMINQTIAVIVLKFEQHGFTLQ